MSNYVVSDSTLTAIANAIRSRTGKSAQIEYADGYVSEINGMIGTSYLDGHLVDRVASAPIASFPDGANGQPMLVTARITPVQDLSGGAPYPPGGGKNLFNPDNTLICRISDAGNIVDQGNYAYRTFYCPSLKAGTYTISVTGLNSNRWVRSMWTVNGENVITGYSVTTNYLTFALSADVTDFYMSFRRSDSAEITDTIYVQIESGSYATAYSPYSHICPIYGWTGAEVNGTGKNLFDKTSGNVLNMSIVNANVLSNSGNAKTVYIPCKPNTTYTVSKNAGLRFTVAYIKTEPANNLPVYGRIVDNSGVTSLTITTGDNAKYLVAYIFNSAYDTGTAQDMIDSVQIELGSTASSYSAYSGTTLSVTFPTPPGTVYGGTLQINKDGSGVITEIQAKKTYTGASGENWKFSTLNGRNRVYITDLVGIYDYNGTFIGNYIKGNQSNLYPDEWYAFPNANSFIIGVPATITSASDFKTYLSTNNLEICYKLATPVEYPLTSQQVGQLLSQNGLNNVWADTGNCAVEYSPDTDLWIQKVLAGESA